MHPEATNCDPMIEFLMISIPTSTSHSGFLGEIWTGNHHWKGQFSAKKLAVEIGFSAHVTDHVHKLFTSDMYCCMRFLGQHVQVDNTKHPENVGMVNTSLSTTGSEL